MYLTIHQKFLEKSNGSTLSKKRAVIILANLYHVRHNLRYAVLKELENMKLIAFVNRREIEVKECKEDLEDTSVIYKKIGLC